MGRSIFRVILAILALGLALPMSAIAASPRVTWITPAAGATVSGTVSCLVEATDDRRVSRVDFYVDGTFLNRERERPYNCAWDTTQYADGSHVLRATAVDNRGNRTSASRTVVVDNAQEPPPAPPPPPPGDWVLVFSDEFDGSAVDTTKWGMYDNPMIGWPTSGINWVRDPAAFTVENGNLVITASMKDGQIHTGGMSQRTDYRYARYEFRVRADPDPDNVMSGVVLTYPADNNQSVGGELDIWETGPYADRTPFTTFIHWPNSGGRSSFDHQADGTQWHDMAMEWEADAIRVWRDGALVWTLTEPAAIPHVLHGFCIQLDAYKSTITGPRKMYVDYVRIYRRP